MIHLVDDNKLGGVNLALQSLCASQLKDHFEFSIVNIDLTDFWPKRFKADVLILHTAASWRKLPGLFLFRLANIGTPIFYQEHHYSAGFMQHEVSHHKRFYLMLRLSYYLMHKVLAVSAAQGRWLLDHRLLKESKLVVIKQARPVDALLSLPDTPLCLPIQLGAYGRFHKQKGFDLLIKAMAYVPAEKIELHLAGEGEMLPYLQSLAAKLDNVTLVGEIDNVALFLFHCDAVIIPSRWEPFGLICQESIAAGKAILTTRVDGLQEQVMPLMMTEHERSSISFIDLTQAGLVQGLEKLITQAETKLARGHKVTHLSGLNDQERAIASKRWIQMVDAWKYLLTTELNKKN
ncbi:glycosyltransferase [Shewanella sp. VB17]|uniref:glycosyltransferase n=1 Tax=Shewanella sp. VB17 TaxID=2739432 RepID=UPI001564D576|nr:glycosyltransferase [Shewanella sp. VB17]NRD72522.1 glycosyltransferase [Shewanella sp. VB17]